MQSIRQTYRQVFPVAAALTVAPLAAGCGKDPVDPPPPVRTTITIAPETATLVSVGETVQRTATVHDQHGAATTGVAVTCSSRDPSVVTVSSGGLVTAEGNGTTAVEASARDAAGSAAIATGQRPPEVRVSPSAETLVALGDTVRLPAEALDANGHAIQGAEFTWSSGDELVLTVDGVLVPGRDVSGSLGSSDDVWDGGSHCDVWSVGATSGQRVVIEMESDDVGSYLRVVRRDGTTIVTDDGESGSDARVEFRAPYSVGYLVIATSYEAWEVGGVWGEGETLS